MGISALYLRAACAMLPLSLLGAAPAPLPMPGSVKVGQTAPPFTLRLIRGGQVSLDALRGNVIVLNFWATWCAPCRRELPTLDRYYELRKDAGLRVYAVATEDSLKPYQLSSCST